MGTTPSPDRTDAKADDSTTPLLSQPEHPVEETIEDSKRQLDATDSCSTELDATLKGDDGHDAFVNISEKIVEDEVAMEKELIAMLKEGYTEKGATPNDVYLPRTRGGRREQMQTREQSSTWNNVRCRLRGMILLIIWAAFANLIFWPAAFSLLGSGSFMELHQAAKDRNANAFHSVKSFFVGTAGLPVGYANEKDVLKKLDYELEVLELDMPVRKEEFIDPGRNTSSECSQVVVQHVFGWSYGKPYVGSYTPPHCEFTHVYFNVTTTSKGRQFDRLWHLFYNDLEIWRSSTAEPTQSGINFHYVKDMTLYSNLLREPGKLILELGNLVDEKYTGSFNVTITATYYSPPLSPTLGAPNLPSAIIPISKRLSHQDKPSIFRLPSDRAVTTISRVAAHKPEVLIPPNIKHMVLSISASGNADEEFWYQNVPSNFTQTFPTTMPDLLGHSSFREIQVLANGRIIAFANPFPHIFTGGINPGLWRPVVAIGTYDVGEVDIDLTAMIPFLMGSLKGDRVAAPTELEIRVVSERDGPIGNDWILTGRLLFWTHDPEIQFHSTTTHRTPIHQMSNNYRLGHENNENKTLDITTSSLHKTHITTTLHYSTPHSRLNFLPPPISHIYTTTLHTTFSNNNTLTASGLNQTTSQLSTSNTLTTSPFHRYSASTSYPLHVTSDLSFDSGFAIHASVNQSRTHTLPPSLHLLYNIPALSSPSSTIHSTTGKASYLQPSRGGASVMHGEGSQFIDVRQEKLHLEAVERYDRSVWTEGGKVVKECLSYKGLAWLECTGESASDGDEREGVREVGGWSGRVRYGAREEGVQWLLGKRRKTQTV